MRIAFFSPTPFSKVLGATKNRIELAESLVNLGWETFLLGNEEIGNSIPSDKVAYREALKYYLIKNSKNFDVVLYEYNTLPFDRSLFSEKTLFVARPALLGHHFQNIKFPIDLRTKISITLNKIKKTLTFKNNGANHDQIYINKKSLSECDLIQVQNQKDLFALGEMGYNREKIIIVPNGISEERFKLFQAVDRTYDEAIKVAFVGTFDFRKGAMDFPFILKTLKRNFRDIKIKLLGTKGLFRTKDEVLAFFPKKYHSSIEVYPTFDPIDLPNLLQDCHIGIFPSYIESFGFGALEMMCAGLPVVSYDSPGPSDFIIKDLLVPIGDKKSLTSKVIQLLENKSLLIQKSKEARQVSKRYRWEVIASEVDNIYKTQIAKKGSQSSTN